MAKSKETAKPAPATELEKNVKLEDIIPQNAQVEINGKTYVLRKVNLSDEAWLKIQGNVEELFLKENMEFMSKFAFRLLVDKSDFLPVTRKGHDDDGNEIEEKVSGPQRILEGMSGPQQKLELIKSLCQTIGISRPLFDKMVEEQTKKKLQEIHAGVKSST